jgi:hypothetical protein
MTDQATTLTAPNLTRLVAPGLTQLSAPNLLGLAGLNPTGEPEGEPGGGLMALVTKTGELTGKFCDLIGKAGKLESGFQRLATRVGGIGGTAGGGRSGAVEAFGDSTRKGVVNLGLRLAEFRKEFATVADGTDLSKEEKAGLRDDIEAQSRTFAIPPQELLAAFKGVLEAGVDPRDAQAILKELAIIIGATRTGGAETGGLAGGPRRKGESGLKILDLAADLQAQRRAGGALEVREIAGPLGRLRQDLAAELGGDADALREAAATLQFFAVGGRDPAEAEADVKTLVEALKDEKVRKRLQAGGIELGDTGKPLEVGRILDDVLRKSQDDKTFLDGLKSPALREALTQAQARAGGAAAAPTRLETFRGAQGGVQDLRDTAAENASGFLATVERGLTDILDFVASGADAVLDNFEPETRQSLVTGGLIGGGAVAGGLAGAGLFKLVGGLFGAGVTKVWITNPPDYFTGATGGASAGGGGASPGGSSISDAAASRACATSPARGPAAASSGCSTSGGAPPGGSPTPCARRRAAGSRGSSTSPSGAPAPRDAASPAASPR